MWKTKTMDMDGRGRPVRKTHPTRKQGETISLEVMTGNKMGAKPNLSECALLAHTPRVTSQRLKTNESKDKYSST